MGWIRMWWLVIPQFPAKCYPLPTTHRQWVSAIKPKQLNVDNSDNSSSIAMVDGNPTYRNKYEICNTYHLNFYNTIDTNLWKPRKWLVTWYTMWIVLGKYRSLIDSFTPCPNNDMCIVMINIFHQYEQNRLPFTAHHWKQREHHNENQIHGFG